MSQPLYNKLVEYTDHLVLMNEVPAIGQRFPQVEVSNEHIRYTYYRLHKELLGTKKINQAYIDFLHTVFGQFDGTSPKTTRSKFATPPKSYNRDFAGYIGEEE